jgi:hypothetical protein
MRGPRAAEWAEIFAREAPDLASRFPNLQLVHAGIENTRGIICQSSLHNDIKRGARTPKQHHPA